MHINNKTVALIEQLLQESNADYLTKYRKGVYASVTLDPTALVKIQKYLKTVGIQMMPLNKIHITVIYSRSRPTSEPEAIDINGEAELKSFGIFGKGTTKEPYALVIEVDSQALDRAHISYKKKYNLKATYPEYKAHMTISYDINRVLPGLNKLNFKQKETIINIFNKMLPELPKRIRILKSTVESLKD